MNPARALGQAPSDSVLVILSGKEKGVAYKIVGSQVSLGRDTDCDVLISDSKASRNHAQIEKRGDGFWIKDLESKIGTKVNGKLVKEVPLRQGDIIKIGDVSLRLEAKLDLPAVPVQPPQKAPLVPPLPGQVEDRNPFILIMGLGLIVCLIFIVMSRSTFNLRKMTIKDDSAFDEEIEGTEQSIQQERKVILEKGKDTQQYAEAQGFYLRGFREYREGNYGRAIQDFEAALALYPDHPLAKRYLDRARLKNNELVTSSLERGERDFQTKRYLAAFNEYRTVIIITNDPKNKYYQLAQKRIETIQLILMNSR